jgi:hypothetical protein
MADAENGLYDLGCDLVEAAAGIARCAADPAAARAVPALLGCVEAALRELCTASAVLQSASSQRTRPAPETLDRGYTNLIVALQDAHCASRAARSLAARHTQTGG